jgi:hypothetical protein
MLNRIAFARIPLFLTRLAALALLEGLDPAISPAQQASLPKLLDFNKHLWVNYSGEHAIRGKYGIHFDAQWRRSDLGTIWQQYQLRPALNVRVSPDVLLTAGYAYTRAYPYGDFPVAAAFPEHRIYQQMLVTKRAHGLSVQQRTRMEQRFIQYPNTAPHKSWTYQNRFRHMVRVEIPLSSPDNANRWYLPVYDEILLGIPPNYGARSFDQNRLAAGIGRAHGPWKAEVVYMNQFLGQRNGRIFEWNNTVVFSIMSSAPLSSLWRND